MNSTYHIIRGTLLLILVIGLGGWAFVRTVKRSEDPARLIFKWILTAVVIGLMFWKVAPLLPEPQDTLKR